MTYSVTPSAGVNIADPTNLNADFAVGATVLTNDGGQAMYIKASGAITAGDVLLISPAGVAVGITTTNSDNVATAAYFIGVAHVSIADGSYGWACRQGVPLAGINVAANCVLGVPLYTTATAGRVDDTATNGLLLGMMLTTTATTAGPYAGVLNNPVLGEGTMGA